MLTAVRGTYKNGQITWKEKPPVQEETEVIVTFLEKEVTAEKKQRKAGSLAGRGSLPPNFNEPMDDLRITCRMRLLIDTQVLIWFQLNDPQLPDRIRLLLEEPDNDVLVSYLSFIEIAIKQAVNRLTDFTVLTEELVQTTKSDGFSVLPISIAHITAYQHIPFHDDHRDPFDRLILATALSEGVPVISADEKFTRYRGLVEVIW